MTNTSSPSEEWKTTPSSAPWRSTATASSSRSWPSSARSAPARGRADRAVVVDGLVVAAGRPRVVGEQWERLLGERHCRGASPIRRVRRTATRPKSERRRWPSWHERVGEPRDDAACVRARRPARAGARRRCARRARGRARARRRRRAARRRGRRRRSARARARARAAARRCRGRAASRRGRGASRASGSRRCGRGRAPAARSPASWRSASQATSAAANASTPAASSGVLWVSGTRSSIVPCSSWTRSSYHGSPAPGKTPPASGPALVVGALLPRRVGGRDALARQQLGQLRPHRGEAGVAAVEQRRVAGQHGDVGEVGAQRVVDGERAVGAADGDVHVEPEHELARQHPRELGDRGSRTSGRRSACPRGRRTGACRRRRAAPSRRRRWRARGARRRARAAASAIVAQTGEAVSTCAARQLGAQRDDVAELGAHARAASGSRSSVSGSSSISSSSTPIVWSVTPSSSARQPSARETLRHARDATRDCRLAIDGKRPDCHADRRVPRSAAPAQRRGAARRGDGARQQRAARAARCSTCARAPASSALTAARLGARATAVDLSRRAVLNARLNARLNRLDLRRAARRPVRAGRGAALRPHRLQPALHPGAARGRAARRRARLGRGPRRPRVPRPHLRPRRRRTCARVAGSCSCTRASPTPGSRERRLAAAGLTTSIAAEHDGELGRSRATASTTCARSAWPTRRRPSGWSSSRAGARGERRGRPARGRARERARARRARGCAARGAADRRGRAAPTRR